MRSMDGHCDVLWKMWEQKHEPPSFYKENSYDVTYPRLHNAEVGAQWFALFIPPEVPAGQRLKEILTQLDLFYLHVIADQTKMIPVTAIKQLSALSVGQCGAFLHLEGADALEGDIRNLRLLYRLGVRQLGLTWNHTNEAADGVGELRNGGLTTWGRELLSEMQRLNMVVDVSHLSVKGFWDVLDYHVPVVASHSNCRTICNHRRNLDDEQIKAIIKANGLMGINFVPYFVRQPSASATIRDLLFHIDHICGLGGERNIYMGSDFDGSSRKLSGLEHMGKWIEWRELLLNHYSEHIVQNWLWNNPIDFYRRHLTPGLQK